MNATSAAILALGRHSCRWPYGDPGEDDFCFCGRGAVQGRAYCPDHCLVSIGLKSAKSVPRPAQAPAKAKRKTPVTPVSREYFRKQRLSAGQGEFRDRLLALLRTYPQGGERPDYRELAAKLNTSAPQVRGIMQRLEQRGWIQRAPFRVLVGAQGEAA